MDVNTVIIQYSNRKAETLIVGKELIKSNIKSIEIDEKLGHIKVKQENDWIIVFPIAGMTNYGYPNGKVVNKLDPFIKDTSQE